MEEHECILEGLAEGHALDVVYKKRNVQYCHANVVKENAQSYLDKGWEKTKSRSRTHVRMRKLKGCMPRIEDSFW